jgi:YD repeat-containing protein
MPSSYSVDGQEVSQPVWWSRALRAFRLIVGCISLLVLHVAQAQTYQYSDWFPVYLQQRRPAPAKMYLTNWDAACREALYPGYEQTAYLNPRGGFHPQFGTGCYYDLFMSGVLYPNMFYQNWVIPLKACATSEWSLPPGQNVCRKPVTYSDSKVCPISNPVDPSDGSKRQSVVDIEFTAAGNRLALTRTFFTESLWTYVSPYGYGWTLDPWARAIRFMPNASAPQAITVWRNARTHELKNDGGGVWKRSPYNGLELRATPPTWTLVDRFEGVVEQFDASGRLVSSQSITGLGVSLSYSPTTLAVATALGQLFSVTFGPGGKVASIATASGLQLTYAFDSANSELLKSVTYSDQSVATYLYEPERAPLMTMPIDLFATFSAQGTMSPTDSPLGFSSIAAEQLVVGRASRYPVTGIIDEASNRSRTYVYDAAGKAVRTERANGVDKYQFYYVAPFKQTSVTDPLGSVRTLSFGTTAQTLTQASLSQPGGSGCGPASAAVTFDSSANVSSRTDFNGQKTCYAYDLSRNVETKRVEGVAASADCATALTTPPAGSRVISTQWHLDWRLETRIAEPNKITTITYNGQGAACAPSTVLVDGKPPAVVCSRSEQATTDATGALGFGAGLTGTARTWTYSYTTYGRVLTATDPNGKTTTTSYYPDDDPDMGRRGNVATVTNAANHVTRITAYNLHGQPTQIVDPNGLVTDLTYDLRMRLTSRKVGSELTTFTYDPRGLLTNVVLPDGAGLTYTYDAAHRLVAIADHQGSRVDYTLDAMGNRISERATDNGGTLVKNIQRTIDALNRVQQITGAQ